MSVKLCEPTYTISVALVHELGLIQGSILSLLIDRSTDMHRVSMGYDDIKETLGISMTTVKRHMIALEDMGFLVKTRRQYALIRGFTLSERKVKKVISRFERGQKKRSIED